MQSHEGSPDHDWAELVLAVRRPAVDGSGDKEIELRPISEDRPEAEQAVRKLPEFGVKQREKRAVRESSTSRFMARFKFSFM